MRKGENKAPSQRQLRIGEEMRHALAQILARSELRDPDLIDATITVSEVSVSPDLRNATAFVMPLGGGGAEIITAALTRAAPFLRHKVAQLVKLKHTPNLKFEEDKSFDYADRIDQLLKSTGPGLSGLSGGPGGPNETATEETATEKTDGGINGP